MHWVYLSPHLDDVAYSCGALVWEQAAVGMAVSVWTVCAGAPDGLPSAFAQGLHDRWQTGPDAIQARREEDAAACSILRAAYRHLETPDCIYRRSPGTGAALYASEEAIFGPIHPDEESLVKALAQQWAAALPPETVLVAPLSLGGHVDHRLVLSAARILAQTTQTPIWFYADFPYVRTAEAQLELLERHGFARKTWPVSPDAVETWVAAAASYRSQVSTFWEGLEELTDDFKNYAARSGGVRLWQRIG